MAFDFKGNGKAAHSGSKAMTGLDNVGGLTGKIDRQTAVASNGLLDRRVLLGRAAAAAGILGTGVGLSATTAGAEPVTEAPWGLAPGNPVPPYQLPSKFAKNVVRTLANPNFEPRTSQSRTPHHLLDGTITPNGLHFTIVHDGVPDIDPDVHRLAIHGLVKRPLIFSLETLLRYPMTSRVAFVECGGNSAPLFSPQAIEADVQALHGLASCAEWTGVKLSTLLDETGIDPKATWFMAEGADPPHLSRSVPLGKALDDAIIALYQNGEPLMPGNGFPMRLLLPGYEGNMNVKYLRRIKLLDRPEMSFYESKGLHRTATEWKSVSLLFHQRGEIFHHPPVSWAPFAGAWPVRDFRDRLFGQGENLKSLGVCGRRPELG